MKHDAGSTKKVLDLAEESLKLLNAYSPGESSELLFMRVWRSYYKLEMAIGLAKFSHDDFRIGTLRPVRFSSKKDITKMSPDKLLAIFQSISSRIRKSEENFRAEEFSTAIETAREARDELKILVGSYSGDRHKKIR